MRVKLERPHSLFLAALSALAGLAIIGGFAMAGSPSQSRVANLDRQRVEDFGELHRAVEEYYGAHNALPESLDQVKLYREVADPESGQAYEYHILDESEYELCAMFDTDLTTVHTWGLTQAQKSKIKVGKNCIPFTVPNYLQTVPDMPPVVAVPLPRQ